MRRVVLVAMLVGMVVAMSAATAYAAIVHPNFGEDKAFKAGPAPVGVVDGSFSQDTRVDLVTANRHGGSATGDVSCLRGNGDGTFDPPKQQDLTVSAWAIEQANFNGDEFSDVVVTDPDSSPPSVNILLGNGDCTFDDGDSEDSGGTGGLDPFDLAVANFDHATGPDVAVTNQADEHRPYFPERRQRRPNRDLTRSTQAPTLTPPA